MSLTDDLVAASEIVAGEIRERFDERGHRVDAAVRLDPSFRRNRRPRSALARTIIEDGFVAGASMAGLSAVSGMGGSMEIRTDHRDGLLVVRLRSAEPTRDGFKVPANGSSSWSGYDEDALIPEYHAVFGYVLGAAGLGDIFIAEVLGATEGNPGELILGDPALLTTNGVAPSGFRTDHDESLPGLDEDFEGQERQA